MKTRFWIWVMLLLVAVGTQAAERINLTVSTNGTLLAPTNFFTINSNLIAAVVAPGGTGTVTSVGVSLPNIFSVSGSPVTGAGTLSGSLVNQSANAVFAGPAAGASAAPSFRALATADLPNLSGIYVALSSFQTLTNSIGTSAYSNATAFVLQSAFQAHTDSLGTASFTAATAYQPASANLTNWSSTTVASMQTALGFSPQPASANLTNWSALATSLMVTSRVGVYRTLWIPAGAMTPGTTNGAATGTFAPTASTNNLTADVLDFDDTSAESAWFRVPLDSAWDGGTLKFKVLCVTTNTTNAVAAVWGVAMGTERTGTNYSADILGTEILVTNTFTAANSLVESAASAAITVAGSPNGTNSVYARIRRVPSDGGDTMAGDARLRDLKLQYKESTTEPISW